MRKVSDLRVVLGALGVAGMLSGCLGGESNNAGTIGFEAAAGSVKVKLGSTHAVVLSLTNANGVNGQSVRLASSDTGIADVFPSACTLSSSSEPSSKCTVTVRGKANGSVAIVAQSTGYSDATLAASVSDSVTYGSLAVASATGSYVTTSPITATYKATGVLPYTKNLKAQIQGSSGIDTTTGAYINYSSSTPNVTVSFNPPQCQVTSASPACDTVMSVTPAAGTTPPTVSVLVAVVGAVLSQNPGYSNITVNANPDTVVTYGDIVLSTQTGNNVPNGMKAPPFVNWNNASQNDVVTVNLSIAGAGASFYSFTAGTNTNITTSSTATCTLTYAGATGSTLGCGFGLVGTAAPNNVTINASATATSGHTYTIAPLTLGVVTPDATRRSVTFTNNSSATVYVGITGGAASAYINPTTTAVPPGTPSANVKPGAGSLCGPSNPQGACPIGSTCLQGGSAPSTDITKTPYYCYYDVTAPSNGYTLATVGSSTTFNISGSSLSPGGVIWSGNFYGRTGCDSTTGICENATCVGANGGLACGPGTGPSPGVNTLAETTFQAYASSDYYDVSIINGANFAVQFGPTNVSISTSDAYTCGVAGSTTAQNGGYPGNPTAGLPAAPWTINPTSSSFPTGASITGDPISYYQLVNQTGTAVACTTSTTCTTAPNTKCGYRMSDVLGGSSTFTTRYCGKPIAFLTADSIWGANESATNAAPFSFATNWSTGIASPSTVAVSDLQLCINSTYSAYTDNGTSTTTPAFPVQPIPLACGGVMWGATESVQQNPAGNVGLNITRPAQPVQTANANWLSYVLPTILWLKQACPTCYTYPFDDMTSTFTCVDNSRNSSTQYNVNFGNLLVN